MSARATRRLVSALLVGIFLTALIGTLSRSRSNRNARLRTTAAGTVAYVHDGDTVEVSGLGKVRLIGIDAMDGYQKDRTLQQSMRHGMSPDRVRHWAGRATQFARERLEGNRVTIRFGPERADDYGRLLGYVHLEAGDGTAQDFGWLMLRQGLATAYRTIPHPRREEYLRAEREARAARLGMWQDARTQP